MQTYLQLNKPLDWCICQSSKQSVFYILKLSTVKNWRKAKHIYLQYISNYKSFLENCQLLRNIVLKTIVQLVYSKMHLKYLQNISAVFLKNKSHLETKLSCFKTEHNRHLLHKTNAEKYSNQMFVKTEWKQCCFYSSGILWVLFTVLSASETKRFATANAFSPYCTAV